VSREPRRGDERLGPLEQRVLETLWRREAAASVRDLQEEFPDLAYTTLMTTLDRLHRKRVLQRRRSGRAYLYTPCYSRAEFEQRRAVDALDALLGTPGDHAAVRPLLSFLVDRVDERDGVLLDELEQLVRRRKRARRP